MQKMENTEHIEGRIYQHSLELKEVKNQSSPNFGKKYIGGTIEVAVDETGMNVIPVEFTYVTETTSKGATNKTFTELMKIINNGKAWLTDGAETATKVTIDTALALNDFPAQDGTMVSQMINQGGFVTVIDKLKEDVDLRHTFRTDVLITNVAHVDADPEKFIDEDYSVIRGAIFNFRNALLPVEFVVKNPQGMKYFEDLDIAASQPVFTKVWGRINFANKSVKETTESAFGEEAVNVRNRKIREWIVTGTSKVPYDFGDERVLTVEEVVKAQQDREIYLADIKKRRDEYMAQKNAATPSAFGSNAVPTPTNNVVAGGFKF